MTKKELQDRYKELDRNYTILDEEWAEAAKGLTKEKLKTLMISKIIEFDDMDKLVKVAMFLGSAMGLCIQLKGGYRYIRREEVNWED